MASSSSSSKSPSRKRTASNRLAARPFDVPRPGATQEESDATYENGTKRLTCVSKWETLFYHQNPKDIPADVKKGLEDGAKEAKVSAGQVYPEAGPFLYASFADSLYARKLEHERVGAAAGENANALTTAELEKWRIKTPMNGKGDRFKMTLFFKFSQILDKMEEFKILDESSVQKLEEVTLKEYVDGCFDRHLTFTQAQAAYNTALTALRHAVKVVLLVPPDSECDADKAAVTKGMRLFINPTGGKHDETQYSCHVERKLRNTLNVATPRARDLVLQIKEAGPTGDSSLSKTCRGLTFHQDAEGHWVVDTGVQSILNFCCTVGDDGPALNRLCNEQSKSSSWLSQCLLDNRPSLWGRRNSGHAKAFLSGQRPDAPPEASWDPLDSKWNTPAIRIAFQAAATARSALDAAQDNHKETVDPVHNALAVKQGRAYASEAQKKQEDSAAKAAGGGQGGPGSSQGPRQTTPGRDRSAAKKDVDNGVTAQLAEADGVPEAVIRDKDEQRARKIKECKARHQMYTILAGQIPWQAPIHTLIKQLTTSLLFSEATVVSCDEPSEYTLSADNTLSFRSPHECVSFATDKQRDAIKLFKEKMARAEGAAAEEVEMKACWERSGDKTTLTITEEVWCDFKPYAAVWNAENRLLAVNWWLLEKHHPAVFEAVSGVLAQLEHHNNADVDISSNTDRIKMVSDDVTDRPGRGRHDELLRRESSDLLLQSMPIARKGDGWTQPKQRWRPFRFWTEENDTGEYEGLGTFLKRDFHENDIVNEILMERFDGSSEWALYVPGNLYMRDGAKKRQKLPVETAENGSKTLRPLGWEPGDDTDSEEVPPTSQDAFRDTKAENAYRCDFLPPLDDKKAV